MRTSLLGLLPAIALLALVGCQTSGSTSKEFPILIGESGQSDLRPCNGYGSYKDYMGNRYYVSGPDTRTQTRHQGIDFCASAGTPVIAASSGTVERITREHPRRGGQVAIKTDFVATSRDAPDAKEFPIYLMYVHIRPEPSLQGLTRVEAGDVIGYLEPPGKSEIGPKSHVHFAASICTNQDFCHTDPNRFWMKGPGIITCFDPENPPKANQIVAPLRCD